MWVVWLSLSTMTWATWPGVVNDLGGVSTLLSSCGSTHLRCAYVRHGGVWPASSCGFNASALGSLCVIRQVGVSQDPQLLLAYSRRLVGAISVVVVIKEGWHDAQMASHCLGLPR